MSSITGISSYNYYTNYPGIYKNPSDSAIAERTTTQVNSLDTGADNLKQAQSVTKIQDGAMEGITDYLQRIRELAVKASNTFTLNDDDRASIQAEIDRHKQGIAQIAEGTTFNEKQLLNGSGSDMTINAGAGSTEELSAGNATLEALGIKDFNVTKDFNIKDIDNALDNISSQRATTGAQSNRLDYATAYNQLSSYNHVASFKEDDMSGILKQADEMRKNRVFETAQMMMQQKQMEQKQQQTMNLMV